MTGGAETVLHIAGPRRFAEILGRRSFGVLALGDAALAPELAIDALALFIAARPVAAVHFLGRAGAHYRDRLLELCERHACAAPPMRHLATFNPIDLGLAAEAAAGAARADALNLALLAADDPLEAAVAKAFAAETAVAALPPPGRDGAFGL